jgi:acyl carrier protein
MEEKLFQYIQEVVTMVTGRKGLLYETDFVQDLGLNSFDIMNIVCAFEDHFDVDIPIKDVWAMQRVKDVIDYMIKHGYTDV